MANLAITGAAALTPLAATDVFPVARPGDATAYKATAAAIKAYVTATNLLMPAVTGTGLWRTEWFEATFNGHKDQIGGLSYNRDVDTQDDALQPSWAMRFESDYYSDATAHSSEWYIAWLAPGGAAGNRVLQANWSLNDNTTMLAVNSDATYFRNAAGDTINAQALPAGWTFNVDAQFAANKGPILADRVDGHTYRIKVTAGVLGTEQVT